MRVGVDIGGAFTHVVLSTEGHLHVRQRLTPLHNPTEALFTILADLDLEALPDTLVHSSPIGINALRTRQGAVTALITTQGFRDILTIGRQDRTDLYALHPTLAPPLIPDRLCYEIPERMDPTGAILKPLSMTALDQVIDDLARQNIQSVAVCLLHSYANPTHERAVQARILERGLLRRWQIVLSCEVLPEFREYERAYATALEAYLRPTVAHSLQRIEDAVRPKPPSLMPPTRPNPHLLRVIKSDGGVMSAQQAQQRAISTLLSGPAAGVVGGFHLAKLAGYDHIITLDVGGTSTHVAICPGELVRRSHAQIDGLPLHVRTLDVERIGAGGGEIAHLDAGGLLCVGPESAGADPGPICYGRGGQRVTLTDAHLALGRLDEAHPLGGVLRLDPEPARAAVAELARAIGLDATATAQGIVDIANVTIARAVRRLSTARGHDPRNFTLVALGGAGPLHACDVAARLGIPRVLIPRHPGAVGGLGLLMADVVINYSRPLLAPVNAETMFRARAILNELVDQARSDMVKEEIAEETAIFAGLVDARYQGESSELTIPFIEDLTGTFHTAYADHGGRAMPERTIEIVALRLQVTAIVEKPALAREPLIQDDGTITEIGHKIALCPQPGGAGQSRISIYRRKLLRPGARLVGPALVHQMDSTTFIAPRWSTRVDEYRNLILEPSP